MMPKLAEATVLHNWRHKDADEAKNEIMGAVGSLANFDVFGTQILVAPYVRPSKTKGGLMIPESAQKDDIYQGKVALVLKVGPNAYLAPEEADQARMLRGFDGNPPQPGDWVFHRIQDCFQFSYEGPGSVKSPSREWQGWPVRLVFASDIYGRIPGPHLVV